MKKIFGFMAIFVAVFTLEAGASFGQSSTAGDIRGVITDSTGAAIPNAQVTITNVETNATRTETSSATGGYRAALLVPGSYKVVANAPGFSSQSTIIAVGAGAVTEDDLKLTVGKTGTVIEVTAEPEIVNTENGDIASVFTAEQVAVLPNPGNDLTFIAQTAPGSIMNTAGQAGTGYGNFSSFGISGLSNMFTLDGGYENDPFLNLNNTGASNLTLGNNEVDTVTVVSPAFSAQYGGLGGAQVTETTKSGGNRLHGQEQYYWNGRVMNANDWFNKQNEAFYGLQNIPQFVNANQWAASIGGPAIRNKVFFYANTEGLRVTVPTTGQVHVPNAAFQACSLTGTGCNTLNAAASANCATNPNSTCVGDPVNGPFGDAFSRAPAAQVPLLTTVFNTYNANRPAASRISADPNDVTADSYFASAASFLTEYIITARGDWHISDKDLLYGHYKQDKGIQPSYIDLIDQRFSDTSPQPAWEGQVSETHNFTSNLVNQLVVAGNYYKAIFSNPHNHTALDPSTIVWEDGDLTTYGGIDFDFPQGRRVAGYQIIDDVTYTKGRNTIHWGYNFRRDNITDLPDVRSITSEAFTGVEAFGYGQVGYEYAQYIPQRLTEPLAVYNQGGYVQDSYKVMPNFTITLGLRVERNSNPKCLTHCENSLAYPVASIPTGALSATTAYNSATPGGFISAGRLRAFKGYQKAALMPRVSFNWQPFGSGSKTVLRGGFGMFSDTFPGSIAETLLSNAPGIFHGIVYGSDIGYPAINLDPRTAGSGGAVAVASNTAFQNAFGSGGNYNTTKAAVVMAGGVYSTPSFTTTAPKISYPTYEEYSLVLEQQLDRKSSIAVIYVGNHGYHEPVANAGTNLTLSTRRGITNFFPEVATTKPVTAFAGITNYYSGASSNFNGVVINANRRSKSVTLQFNYQYSHALDEISNGGLEAFGGADSEATANPYNLHAQYGNADYNVKHNVTGSVVYILPSYHRFQKVTGGIEIASTVFHQSGLPYTVTESTSSVGVLNGAGVSQGTAAFSNGGANLYARQVSNNFDHHCGGSIHALLPDGTNPHPCNFTSTSAFTQPTDFTQQGRNGLTGPSYTDVDFSILKTFDIPYVESMKLKFGAQIYNGFNHPNFSAPSAANAASPSSSYGAISGTVSSPTSIFGSTGASASPRIIQLKAALNF